MRYTRETITRDVGLSIRQETIRFFTSDQFLDVLHKVMQEDCLAQTLALPPSVQYEMIYTDMFHQPEWAEEFWAIDADGHVSMVDSERFHSLDPEQRFSHSDCLRRPENDAFAIRGLLSGLHSPDVYRELTSASGSGSEVSFISADIARYRPGHYLRRHDDVYDGRRFGLIFFLHDSWEQTSGTRLVAENPDGRCKIVDPIPGTVALMRLAGGHYHQVEQNFSRSWDRYSMAVHFGNKQQ